MSCQSTRNTDRRIPDAQPTTNCAMKATQKSSGTLNSMLPRHRVASQLKILIAAGTATASDVIMKNHMAPTGIGAANMC